MAFQSCRTCQHPEHGRINDARANGTGLAALEKEFHITKSSLSRHFRNCLGVTSKNKGRSLPYGLCKQFVWYDQTCPAEMQNSVPPDIARRNDYLVVRVSFETANYYSQPKTEEKSAETDPLPIVDQK
jgi:hypothetical protein